MEQQHPSGQAPRENKMGVMPVGRLLTGMAIPVVISMLVQALYNVVDSIFVARISQDALNAVSLAFPLQNLMIAVGIGTAVGTNALLSRSLGEKKQNMADRAANTAIFLAVCNAVVFAVGGLLGTEAFLRTQTDNPVILEYGCIYGKICLGLSLGLFFQFCFERLLQSTGRTLLSMVTQLVGAGLNIILDPILIFGLFGAPEMGVAGAALATVIGQMVGAAVGLLMNMRFNPEIHVRLRSVRWDTPVAREIYRVGIPTMIMQSIGSVMIFGVNMIVITFTEAATAVFGAYFKLQSFIFMPVFGLNNSSVPIVAYNYGAGRMDRVRHTIRLTATSAVCIMIAGFLLFQFAPDFLMGFFTPTEEMLSIGRVALRVISWSFPLAGFCIVASSVFQAIGNPVHSLLISLLRQLGILVPAAWALARTGVLALVWLAFPIAEIVALILSAITMRHTLRAAQERVDSWNRGD